MTAPRPSRLAVGLALLAVLGLTGCSGADPTGPAEAAPAAASAAPSTSSTSSTEETATPGSGKHGGKHGGKDGSKDSGDSTGSGEDAGAVDTTSPTSPFVAAASAVALRSRDQVLQLHAMAVSTTVSPGGFPPDQIGGVATLIGTELGRQIGDATMMPPPPGSPAARLVSALRDYRRLADTLQGWHEGAPALSPAYFRKLRATDRSWRASLAALGTLADEDLLAGLPELVMPR